MDFDQTQVLALDEFEDETDEEITQSQNAPVAHIRVPCQKGIPEKNYPLYEGNNIIGRQESCNIYIPSKALSKQHACIEIRGDSHLLYDCDSRNKTRRGKLFLSPNVRYELKHKDNLTFADVRSTYVIEKDICHVEDSGSDTGSESVLQAKAVDDSTVLDETKEEDVDDDASDASSDILQPTQPSSSSQMWKTSKMMEATQKFKEDDINGNLTVQDTPCNKRDQSGDLSTLVLPDSDSEDDEDRPGNPQATLVFEEEKDTSGDQDILAAATQAFPVLVGTDDEDEGESKKDLLCAPTQAFGPDESGTDDEDEPKVDLDAPTLAVVENSETDEEALAAVDMDAATQAVGMDDDEEEDKEEMKTVAYDMDLGDKKTPGKSKPTNTCAPTQAYTMEVDDTKKSKPDIEPTVAYDLDAEVKTKEEAPNATQSFSISEEKAEEKTADKSDTEDRGLVPTQVFEEDEEDDDEENINPEDVSHLLTTPTLACDMDMDEEDSDSDLPAGLDEDKMMEAETQAVGNDDATQAFEDADEKVEKVKSTDDDKTQVVDDDATLAVSESSPVKAGKKVAKPEEDDATQVFEDDATLAVSELSVKKGKKPGAPKSNPAEDETQVVEEDATQVIEEAGDATQVFGAEDATVAIESDSVSKNVPNDDATQVIGEDATQVVGSDDATQVIDGDDPTLAAEDVGNVDETQVIDDDGEKGDSEDATQVFTDATLAAEEVETGEKNSDEDATQVFGNDDPTLACSDLDDKSKSTEDATQVFAVDATVAISEDATDETQVIEETDATVTVEEDVPVRRGRGRAAGKSKDAESEAPTLHNDEPDIKPGRGRRRTRGKVEPDTMQVDEPTIAIEAAADDTTKTSDPSAADATLAIEQVEEEPVRGRGRKGAKSQKSEQPEDVTLAVEDGEEERPKGRGQRAVKSPKTEQAEDVTVARGQEAVKRGRGKKMTKTADEPVPGAEDATLLVAEAKPERGRGKKADTKTQDKPKPEDDTLSLEETPQPKRGRGRKMPDLESTSEQPPLKRGRGRQTKSDAAEVVATKSDSDEKEAASKSTEEEMDADVLKEVVAVSSGEEATQLYGKEESSDSEDSTLPVEELVNMVDVEDKGKKPTPAKKGKTTKASPKKGASSGGEASDLEPTQQYGLDEPEATQQYGLDLSDEVIPESQGRRKGLSPMIPLPNKSPHKSALASPRRSPSPSPKRVVFAPGVEDNENKTQKPAVGRGRGRRSLDAALANGSTEVGSRRRSLPARGVSAEDTTTVGKGRGRGRNAKKDDTNKESAPVEKPTTSKTEDTESAEPEIESVSMKRRGRVLGKKITVKEETDDTEAVTADAGEASAGRGRRRKGPVVEAKKEIPIEKEAAPEAPVGRGRRGKKGPVKEEAAAVVEDTSDKSESTTARGRRGKKDTNVEVIEPSEKAETSTSVGRSKKGEADKEEESKVPETERGRGRKRSAQELEEANEDETSSRKTRRGNEAVEIEDETAVGRRGRSRSEEVKEDVKTMKGGKKGTKNIGVKEEKIEKTEEEVPSKGRRGRNKPEEVETKTNTKLPGKTSEKDVEEVKTTGRRGRRNIESKDEKSDSQVEGGTKEDSQPVGKDEAVPKRGRRKVSAEKAEEPDGPETSGRKGRIKGKAQTQSKSSEADDAQTVAKTEAKTEADSEVKQDAARKGRRSNVLKTITESQPDKDKPIPVKKGRASAKEANNDSAKGDEAPKRGRRGRSASTEGSVSSRESSLDSSVQGRATRGKKPVDTAPSTTSSRKRNKDSQDVEESGVSRSRQSLTKQDEKSSKGKAAKTNSQSSSQTDEPRTTRKRSSNDSVDPETSKRSRKGVETVESETTANTTKVNRASKKDNTSKEETPVKTKAETSSQGQEVKVKSEEKGSKVTASKKRRGEQLDDSLSQESEAAPNKKSRPSDVGSPKGRKSLKADVASPSLRRKSMEPKPKVLFTGVVDAQGQKVVKDLGGELATSIHDCTHLVTDKVRRTVKFLGGLARGVPILTTLWLTDCKSAGTFLDSTKYLVSDTASEKQHKFSLKKSLARATVDSMLSGYKIHVTKSVQPDPPQMKDILICAGAQYLSTMPKKSDDSTVVVSCDEDKPACAAAIKSGIPVVSSEFILTGILRQEVDLDSFRLFADDNRNNGTKARSKSRR